MKRPLEEPSVEENEEQQKISKHTLDSDEEIEDAKNGRMRYEELIGQEAETLEYDGEIRITPFNMRDELEEDGYFDGSGTFIFNRNNEVGDNWLEEVDWLQVKKNEEIPKAPNIEEENEKLPLISTDERLKLYQEVSSFMLPKETVLKTLKRIGPSKTRPHRTWTRRKDGTVTEKEDVPVNKNSINFERLTELSNDLLGSGDFDIYQKTKEVIDGFVTTATTVGEESELDAIAATLDGGETEESTTDSKSTTEVKWVMKKGGVDADTEVEGPFSTEEVRMWLKNRIFADPSKIFISQQSGVEQFRPLDSVELLKFT